MIIIAGSFTFCLTVCITSGIFWEKPSAAWGLAFSNWSRDVWTSVELLKCWGRLGRVIYESAQKADFLGFNGTSCFDSSNRSVAWGSVCVEGSSRTLLLYPKESPIVFQCCYKMSSLALCSPRMPTFAHPNYYIILCFSDIEPFIPTKDNFSIGVVDLSGKLTWEAYNRSLFGFVCAAKWANELCCC